MESIGIGLIGCGQIARQRYLPLIQRTAGARIAAVCTAHDDTAQAAAARLGPGVRATTDVGDLLQSPEVQAVIISTPHRDHARQAVAALRAGRHVLVEKPMATTWADALALRQAASDQPGCVAMVLPREHRPALAAMVTCLAQEGFGTIVAVDADFSGPGAPPGADWKYSLTKSGGGVLVAHAVYALDLIASLCGPARRVSAFANTLVPERRLPDGRTVSSDIEDNVVITLEYASGLLATVRSSWAYPGRERRLVIQGTLRRLVMTPTGVRLEPGRGQGRNRAAAEEIPLSPEKENLVEHFLRCIRTGAPPDTDIDQALHVTEQMVRAYDGARTGAAQALETAFQRRSRPIKDAGSGR